MARLSSLALFSAGMFALAACADSKTLVDPTSTAPSMDEEQGYARAHLHPLNTHASEAHVDAQNRAAAKAGSTGITYHGGPVLQTGTKVAAIYWASAPIYTGGPTPGTTGTGVSDGSLVGHFLRNIGGSPYFNINSSYTDGAGLKIVNAVAYTQFWANNTNVPADGANVTDAQMASMLQAGFNSGALVYDPSTLYTIFTAGKVNLGGGFGTQYCAYHTHATITIAGVARTVLYAAQPYNYAYPSACTSGLKSPNNDPGADAEVSTLVHEIEETTTDMMGNAWYDRRGYENADKCAWTWGTTYTTANGGVANMNLGGKDFLVQQNWINSGSGGC
ncbi:MAG: hypothetical protein JO040_11775, partial [Gemmatimonadetes bacterium]|nr:hypothetical protein [Gemmatimonadota bacterium]